MSRPALDRKRQHVWLDNADVEWLNAHYGRNIKISAAVRMMVKTMIKQIEAKAKASAVHPALTDDDLALLDEGMRRIGAEGEAVEETESNE